jgi:hypothetical protein
LYADQWLPRVQSERTADAAICVFDPNEVLQPRRSSLEYLGEFDYEVVHPEVVSADPFR